MFQLIVFSLQELDGKIATLLSRSLKNLIFRREKKEERRIRKKNFLLAIRDRDNKSKRGERGRKEPRKININYKIIKKREKIQFETLRCKRKKISKNFILYIFPSQSPTNRRIDNEKIVHR